MDALLDDISLSNSKDLESFTGISSNLTRPLNYVGNREMLWIEYKATQKVEIGVVMDVLQSLAKILTPFPICAYDRGEYGFGCLVHDGIYSVDASPPLEEKAPIPIDTVALSSSFTTLGGTVFLEDVMFTASTTQQICLQSKVISESIDTIDPSHDSQNSNDYVDNENGGHKLGDAATDNGHEGQDDRTTGNFARNLNDARGNEKRTPTKLVETKTATTLMKMMVMIMMTAKRRLEFYVNYFSAFID